LQRAGDTIAPSALSSFIALSTSLRSRPERFAILPALSGVPAYFIVSNTVSFVAIIISPMFDVVKCIKVGLIITVIRILFCGFYCFPVKQIVIEHVINQRLRPDYRIVIQ